MLGSRYSARLCPIRHRLQQLESRQLLAIDAAIIGNDLVISDIASDNDRPTISIDGTSVMIGDLFRTISTSIAGATGNGTNLVTVPLSLFSGDIVMNLGGGADLATLDYSTGDFSRHIVYDGGGPDVHSDRLQMSGGGFTNGNFAFTNEHSGTVDLDGQTIAYTNLERILWDSHVLNTFLQYSDADETITVENYSPTQFFFESDMAPTWVHKLGAFGANPKINVDLGGGFNQAVFETLTLHSETLRLEADDIFITSDVSTTIHGDIELSARGSIQIDTNSSISAEAGDILLNVDTDSANGGTIALGRFSSLTTTDGDITLGGGSDPEDFPAIGTAAIPHGVFINEATIASQSGDISIRGQTQPGASLARGVLIQNSSTVMTTSGGILIIGATDGGTSNLGTEILTTEVSTSTGRLRIEGTSDGVGENNLGMRIAGASVVESTGAGARAVTITGSGSPNGSTNNVGVSIVNSGTAIRTVSGNLSITGNGGSSSSGDFNDGTQLADSATVQSTGSGTITLTGNAGAGLFSNHGVRIQSSTVQSRGGDILLRGTSAGTTTHNTGVLIVGGAQVTAEGTTGIEIDGDGSSVGTGRGNGVEIDDAGTLVQVVDGPLTITADAGGSGRDNRGLLLQTGATVRSTGTTGANVLSLTGNGSGDGTEANIGILLVGADTSIESVEADLMLTGAGGSDGTGNANDGVHLGSGTFVESTGGASITMNGTGAAGTGVNIGVRIEGGAVQASGGPIEINGSSLGTTSQNAGVSVLSAGRIEGTGATTISISGDASTASSGSSGGVQIESAATLSTDSGAITISGTGGGTGATSFGIDFSTGAQVTSTTGAISLNGTGAADGGAAAAGISIEGNSVVSTGGDVSLTGVAGGTTTAANSHGVQIFNNSRITASGASSLLIDGQGAGDNGAGFVIDNARIEAGSGPLTVLAERTSVGDNDDAIAIQNGASLSGTSTLDMRPKSPGETIQVGGAPAFAGYSLNSNEVASLADGFSTITIGDPDNSTGTTVVFNSTFSDQLRIVAGTIFVTGLNTGANPVHLVARTGAIVDNDLDPAVVDVTASEIGLER